jgi:hypothetical protein
MGNLITFPKSTPLEITDPNYELATKKDLIQNAKIYTLATKNNEDKIIELTITEKPKPEPEKSGDNTLILNFKRVNSNGNEVEETKLIHSLEGFLNINKSTLERLNEEPIDEQTKLNIEAAEHNIETFKNIDKNAFYWGTEHSSRMRFLYIKKTESILTSSITINGGLSNTVNSKFRNLNSKKKRKYIKKKKSKRVRI